MYIAIIISVVIVLLAILVMINFADSDVSRPVRIIVSSIILLIFAAGVYYLTSPKLIVTSTPVQAIPGIPDTQPDTRTIEPKDPLPAETLKKDTPKAAASSLVLKPKEVKKPETDAATVTSAPDPIPPDTVSTKLAATETLTPNTRAINACTSWIVMSTKAAKVTYRDCCTNTDKTIIVTGSLGICAVYGFTPSGPGVLVISNSTCNCK